MTRGSPWVGGGIRGGIMTRPALRPQRRASAFVQAVPKGSGISCLCEAIAYGCRESVDADRLVEDAGESVWVDVGSDVAGDQHDRHIAHPGVGVEPALDVTAVHSRQHEIEHDGINRLPFDALKGVDA